LTGTEKGTPSNFRYFQ